MKTLFLVGMLLLSFPVFAGQSDDGFYTRTDVSGVYSTQKALKNGYGLQLGFGQKWNGFFRGELTTEYTRIRMKEAKAYHDTGARVYTHLPSFAVMTTGYVDIFGDKKISPYVGFGIGVSRNDAQDAVVDGNPFFGKTNYRFAWKVVGGLGYRLPKNFVLDLGYSYTDLGDFSVRDVLKKSFKQDVKVRKVNIGLRYLF